MRTLVSLLLVAGAACVQSSPAPPPQPYAYGPPPGARCMDGPAMCAADRSSVVQCQRGAWIVLQSCPGPQGCNVAGGAIQCDTSSSSRGAGGESCSPEGGYGCTADRRGLTACRSGRTVLASTCRGARGCVVGNAIECDNSLAAIGDPCDGPKDIACSLDNKQLLRCAGNFFQLGEPCRNACLATKGRVLCQ